MKSHSIFLLLKFKFQMSYGNAGGFDSVSPLKCVKQIFNQYLSILQQTNDFNVRFGAAGMVCGSGSTGSCRCRQWGRRMGIWMDSYISTRNNNEQWLLKIRHNLMKLVESIELHLLFGYSPIC